VAVAQICNLLYRGFLIRQAWKIRVVSFVADTQPNAIRRYSRFQICAAGPAPDVQFKLPGVETGMDNG
jgi:hypothetical protein